MKKTGAFKDYKSRKIAGVTVFTYEKAIRIYKSLFKRDDGSMEYFSVIYDAEKVLHEIGFGWDEIEQFEIEAIKEAA